MSTGGRGLLAQHDGSGAPALHAGSGEIEGLQMRDLRRQPGDERIAGHGSIVDAGPCRCSRRLMSAHSRFGHGNPKIRYQRSH